MIAKTKESLFPRKRMDLLALTFKESLMNSWSFRQAYFDFSNKQYYDDIPPSQGPSDSIIGDAVNEKKDSVFLNHDTEYLRDYIKNRYLIKFLNANRKNKSNNTHFFSSDGWSN